MDKPALRQIIVDLISGSLGPDEAVARLQRMPFADLGFARVDHHRALRQKIGEAVYGPGKTPEQCEKIVAELLSEQDGGPVLLTRADTQKLDRVLSGNPGGTVSETVRESSSGKQLFTVVWRPALLRPSRIMVVTAGTGDIPVAVECRVTLEAYGYRPTFLADCGVAGVHRLMGSVDDLVEADAVVVVAGMEGALASLIGGITPAPVVAVPVSTGYGAAFEGITALLAMLSSCAAGITVVGIDNGFGAACAVARILL
ncbi:MAG: nickel pincer cofactor biosynthesis protein LarB [Acidimicrobiales bacterium]